MIEHKTIPKILLVSFPVDLGSRTIESNFKEIFENEIHTFSFASRHTDVMDTSKISFWQSVYYRLISVPKLRKAVRSYVKGGYFIIFHGVSPALFSYGIWKSKNTAIAFDWMRTLRDQIEGNAIHKNAIFYIHKWILTRGQKMFVWTDALKQNLISVYNVNQDVIFKSHAPLLVDNMKMIPRPTNSLPRVLFVGGDFIRKGGDIVLRDWQEKLKGKCILTMVTNDQRANSNGINFLPGIKYGTNEHIDVFFNNDILILPTRFDAFPQVIGEAAAAGLAVITTRFALGAKEVITNNETGFICDTPEECIDKLLYLLSNHTFIDKFKKEGFQKIHKDFNTKAIRERYLENIYKS